MSCAGLGRIAGLRGAKALAVIAALFVGAACGKGGSETSVKPTGQPLGSVSFLDGERYNVWESSRLTVHVGMDGAILWSKFELGADSVDVKSGYLLALPVNAAEILASGHTRVTLPADALGPGIRGGGVARVDQTTGTGTWATAGTVDIQFVRRQVTGSAVDLVPADLDATFESPFLVVCTVDGVSDGGGTSPDGAAHAYYTDLDLSTPQCVPLRKLTPP